MQSWYYILPLSEKSWQPEPNSKSHWCRAKLHQTVTVQTTRTVSFEEEAANPLDILKLPCPSFFRWPGLLALPENPSSWDAEWNVRTEATEEGHPLESNWGLLMSTPILVQPWKEGTWILHHRPCRFAARILELHEIWTRAVHIHGWGWMVVGIRWNRHILSVLEEWMCRKVERWVDTKWYKYLSGEDFRAYKMFDWLIPVQKPVPWITVKIIQSSDLQRKET